MIADPPPAPQLGSASSSRRAGYAVVINGVRDVVWRSRHRRAIDAVPGTNLVAFRHPARGRDCLTRLDEHMLDGDVRAGVVERPERHEPHARPRRELLLALEELLAEADPADHDPTRAATRDESDGFVDEAPLQLEHAAQLGRCGEGVVHASTLDPGAKRKPVAAILCRLKEV